MAQRYCLDASVFINCWRKHYRPDVFPTFWKEIDNLIEQDTIFSCHDVFLELERQKDDLLDWADERKHIFEQPTEDITKEMAAFMPRYQNFVYKGGASINAADPWLIIHAKLAGATVVTYERRAEKKNPKKPPKIPDVCDELNIECLGVVDFLAANGLSF